MYVQIASRRHRFGEIRARSTAQAGLTTSDVDLSQLAIANMAAALQNGALDSSSLPNRW